LDRAARQPVRYVMEKAWLFAGSYLIVSLIFALLIPGWSRDLSPGHLLFVGGFAGLFTSLTYFTLARSSALRSAETTGTPVP
jgi:hypothetical protein